MEMKSHQATHFVLTGAAKRSVFIGVLLSYLSRKDGWFCFGALRTAVIENVRGGAGQLAAVIMRTCFLDGTSNFTNGFNIHDPNGGFRTLAADFTGWLSDEKALKEFFDIKGQAEVKS